jgi:hypothetical protein
MGKLHKKTARTLIAVRAGVMKSSAGQMKLGEDLPVDAGAGSVGADGFIGDEVDVAFGT